MHLGIDFSSILMVFGRQVGRQNGPKIDSKKHGKKHAKKDQFFNALGGGAPRACHLRAGIVRPPKDQTPLELGKGLGVNKGKGLGTGKHRHKGKGKDTGQVGKITHSRRRAKRGGG